MTDAIFRMHCTHTPSYETMNHKQDSMSWKLIHTIKSGKTPLRVTGRGRQLWVTGKEESVAFNCLIVGRLRTLKWNSSMQSGCGKLVCLVSMCELVYVRVRSLCVSKRRVKKNNPPVWSTAAGGKLFSAFLHLLPPSAGSAGNSVAMSLICHSDSLGIEAPTVAHGTSGLFCFLL